MALPTARAAIGEPTIAATAPYVYRLARWDLAHGSVHGGVEGGEPAQVDRWQRAAGDARPPPSHRTRSSGIGMDCGKAAPKRCEQCVERL